MSDALISPDIGATFYAASGALLVLSCRKLQKDLVYTKNLPLAGILGAFVFSAQMINFAVPGTGSSGHIGGGFLLALLLGPYPTVLIMASILTVQCLLFADGGLLALGCNIFNLAVYPAFFGLPVYLLLRRFGDSKSIRAVAAVCAVLVSLEAGALSVVVQTVMSGRSELPFSSFSLMMLGIHFPIAVVEGLITAAVFSLLDRIAENGVDITIVPQAASGRVYVSLAVFALFVGGVGAWFASPSPDGLEWSVAKITGTEELAGRDDGVHRFVAGLQTKLALLPDYDFAETAASSSGKTRSTAAENGAEWPNPSTGTSLSGFIGGTVTALLVLLTGIFLRRSVKPVE